MITMSFKSRLRILLGDLLVKSPVSGNYRNRVANKEAIKNIILDEQALSPGLLSQSPGGLVRILASDRDNAKQIASLIQEHKDDLCIKSVHFSDRALEYSGRYKEEPVYKNSVIVKLDTKTLLQSVATLNSPERLRQEVLEERTHDASAADTTASDGHRRRTERIVIDFSSPNIAKPFHFGHLKSTILGNYLANIHNFLGNEVTRLNYIGDWGTQYGLLSLGMEEFGGENGGLSEGVRSPLRYLLEAYVKANERGLADENFYTEARRRFSALETEPEQLEKWRKIRELSLEELRRSYSRLGVEFDVFEFESDYAKDSISLAKEMISLDFTRQLDDGAIVAQVEKKNKILDVPLVKSDGASLYISREVAAAISRKKRFNFDRMLYVVGADQEKHFHSLREIVKKSGHDWYNRLIHVKMGKVLGMSSRSGKFVLLSDMISDATAAYIASTKGTPTSKVTDKEEIDNVGRHLALSALFVFDIRNVRTRSYEFDWNRVMVASERSGINLQTTFARLSSLLERAASAGMEPMEPAAGLSADAICCVEGINLVSMLDELDTALHSSYWSMDPAPLVNYALRLCKAINRARKSPRLWVMGEADETMARTRLSLFKWSHSHLELIIKLIGLKPLYKV